MLARIPNQPTPQGSALAPFGRGSLVSVLTLANSCATRLQGGAWSVRVPITIASFAPIHIDGLLCARFTPPRPSAGAPLGKADARPQHERWCQCPQN